jgi:hypothetical protein
MIEYSKEGTVRRFQTVLIAIFIAASLMSVTMGASSQATDVTGTWKLTVETQAGSGNPTVILKQDGENITGTYKGQFGEAPLTGTIKGNAIKFSFKVDAQGQALQIDYAGTVDGKSMKGTVKLGDFGDGTFTATKE